MAKGYRFASVVSMAVLDSLDRTSSNGRLLPASGAETSPKRMVSQWPEQAILEA